MERRLAAILAADVVGYSRLMGADEAGTLSRITADQSELIEPLAAAHNGRVVKRIGDGVLMEFASAVDAVTFAVELQAAAAGRDAGMPEDRRIRYRIGINIGDIILQDGDIFGDGVNIAARLEESAEAGGIRVSGQVHETVAAKTDLRFAALGDRQFKNIDKPIPVFEIVMADGGAATRHPAPERPPRHRIAILVATLAVIALAAGLAYTYAVRSLMPGTPAAVRSAGNDPVDHRRQASEKPSLIVLPFDNLSGDSSQDYFSDGITEDLTTDISKISGLLVLARHTAFKFAGRGVDVRDIGRELGVDYVLEGSVRRADNRVRVNAQLIDARTGNHLWADRFDRELKEVFQLQDEVTRNIVAALTVELTTGEDAALSHRRTVDPEAYDLFLQGLARFQRFTPETNREARALFHAAARRDPSFARAIADIGLTHGIDLLFNWAADPDMSSAEAAKYSRRALEIDPSLREVHFAMSTVNLSRKQIEAAIDATEKAILIDPNYADAYAQRAQALAYFGKPDESLASLDRAKALNPLHPFYYTWIGSLAGFVKGDYDAAIAISKDVAVRNPDFTGARLILAASYGLGGRQEDAEWEVEELLAQVPNLTLALAVDRAPFVRDGDRARYADGLRRAGLR